MNKPFVKVTWDDAEDQGGTWLEEAEVEEFADHNCTVVSVGYLVSKTGKYLTLAADWIDELKHYGRVTKIPVGMVISVEEFK